LLHAPKNGFFYVIDRTIGKLISAEKLGKVTWATKVDMATGKPILTPNARYENGPVTLWPSFQGVHNLYAQSFSARTGLVYIPIIEMSATYDDTGIDPKNCRFNTRDFRAPMAIRRLTAARVSSPHGIP
jgi:quinohemoprotein ethanol dehydrogenase